MSDDDVDLETEERIAAYTAELRAEAQLARGDIAELADHLRCVAAELREHGLPATAAVAEAARRLGDPREVAREHARTASPFGERLTKQRAWGAAALVAPFTAYAIVRAVGQASVPLVLEGALGTILLTALVLRLSWARAIMFGTLADVVFHTIMNGGESLLSGTFANSQVTAYILAAALLWPRRRGEISAAGYGLALMSVAYGGAIALAGLQLTDETGAQLGGGLALASLGAVAVGALGSIVRARWGAVAMMASAGMLAIATHALWGLTERTYVPETGLHYAWSLMGGFAPEKARIFAMETMVIAAMAAASAAVLSWRSARSTLGTLRGVIA